jgi:LmbE family N-acetylglucosaminyl deacetylase
MHDVSTVGALGTILGIWAHPDDEAYLSSGLMALARRRGSRVVVGHATLGGAGTDDPDQWPAERLARHRRAELEASLDALGVHEHHWMGYEDGECDRVADDEGIAAVTTLIERVRPSTIVTFGPEGMTGHPDHRAVSRWTTAAWEQSAPDTRLWYATLGTDFHERWGELNDEVGLWNGAEPPSTPIDDLAAELRLCGPVLDAKLAALRAHESQTAGLVAHAGVDRFRAWWSVEYFREASRSQLVGTPTLTEWKSA